MHHVISSTTAREKKMEDFNSHVKLDYTQKKNVNIILQLELVISHYFPPSRNDNLKRTKARTLCSSYPISTYGTVIRTVE